MIRVDAKATHNALSSQSTLERRSMCDTLGPLRKTMYAETDDVHCIFPKIRVSNDLHREHCCTAGGIAPES